MTTHPLPLVPEDIDGRSGMALRAFVRSVICAARARASSVNVSPFDIAKKSWPGDRQLERILRAAVAPSSLTNTAAAVSPVMTELLMALAPLSAAASLINRTFKLRFAEAGQIYVPGIVTAPQMAFVAEGEPLPVAMGLTNRLVLGVRKLAGIVAFTREMLASARAEDMVRQVLIENTSAALDGYLLSQSAGDSTKPSGLFYNVAPLPPATDTLRLENMIDDVGALIAGVAKYAGTGDVAIVASPAQWAAVKLRSPQLGFPVWSSTALTAGTVAAIALPTFVSANEDVPTFDLSMTTALTTTDPGLEFVDSGGTVGAPTQSAFQADLVALKLNLPVSWGLRAPGVSWLEGANW
jgi:hypothetical protein